MEEPVGMGELVRRMETTQSEWGAGSLTARMTPNGEFSHFIINKDKKAVGSGTEPP